MNKHEQSSGDERNGQRPPRSRAASQGGSRANNLQGEFARDRAGNILRDRYGRPVPKRPVRKATGSSSLSTHPPSGQSKTVGRHAARSASSQRSERIARPPQQESGRSARQPASASQSQAHKPQGQPAQYVRAGANGTRAQQGQSGAQRRGRRGSGTQGSPAQSRRRQPSQRTQGSLRTKAPRKHTWRKIVRTLEISLVVILVTSIIGLILVDRSLNRTDALAKYDGRIGNTAGSNWLLLGSDSREGLSEEDRARLTAGDEDDTQRADSIIVIHIPRFGGKAKMMSIPRDSYVNIPNYGMDKINVTYSLGGPQLLQRTIEENTGIRIDHFAEIGFGGFSDVVDAVGGVEMCPPEPIDDPMAGINIGAGCQEFDGPTALGYVRTRYTSAGGDLDRMDRQKEFLNAIAHKVSSPGVILNPFKFWPTVSSMENAVTVNTNDHIWNLMWLALAISRGTEQATIPIADFVDYDDVGNVAIWDDEEAEALFETMR